MKNLQTPKTVEEIVPIQESYRATNGDPAPLFQASAVIDHTIKPISLEDYFGKWIVLFFYPSDFTFVWPTELAAVAVIHPDLKSLNTEVIAISTDSIFSHKKYFDTSEKLKDVRFPVVSDRTQQISRAYRVLDPRTGASFRATIIIEPEGTIVGNTVYPNDVGRNIDELKRMIEALRYSKHQKKATPANWKPGEVGIRRDHNRIE